MLSSKPQDNYIMLYARVTMDTPSLDTIMGAKAGMGESSVAAARLNHLSHCTFTRLGVCLHTSIVALVN
jgi:hypothetical protein